MAQYQHLPIYKATYELLLRVTEVTSTAGANVSVWPGARSAPACASIVI